MSTCADVSWFSSTESSLVFILSTSTLIPLQIKKNMLSFFVYFGVSVRMYTINVKPLPAYFFCGNLHYWPVTVKILNCALAKFWSNIKNLRHFTFLVFDDMHRWLPLNKYQFEKKSRKKYHISFNTLQPWSIWG